MHKMNRFIVFLSFIFFAISPCLWSQEMPVTAPEKVGLSAERLQRLSKVMQSYIDDDKLAGIVGLVSRRGKIAYLKSFGMMDKDAKKPMADDAIFRIASMSKAITSVAVMMLYEEGRFLLDDPISDYIPAFKKPHVLIPKDSVDTSDPPYELVPAKREITIRDLLTHTSGIIYRFVGHKYLTGFYKEAGISDGLTQTEGTIGDMVQRLAKLPLLHQPGERFSYGLNTDVLGYFVEVVSGQSLEAFFSERIFKPLDMVDTYFFLPANKLSRLPAVYSPNEKGGIDKLSDEEVVMGSIIFSASFHYKGPRTHFSGGAGLVSTARDYARFLQMLLNNGELGGVRLLSRKTVELMTTNHLSHIEQGNFMFGLGFAIQADPGKSGTMITEGTYGWGGFFNTRFWIDPKEELIGIFMSQRFPNQDIDAADKFQVLVYQAIVD